MDELNLYSEIDKIGNVVETKDHIEGTPDEETGFEKAYYNFADRVKLPENAIKVEDLYDILFSPESKETMKNQF
ncbi:hypothetical protein MAR_038176, partial [Mya arenaria]